jgi:hypothetical protein
VHVQIEIDGTLKDLDKANGGMDRKTPDPQQIPEVIEPDQILSQ